jgi:hypothetical protein
MSTIWPCPFCGISVAETPNPDRHVLACALAELTSNRNDKRELAQRCANAYHGPVLRDYAADQLILADNRKRGIE